MWIRSWWLNTCVSLAQSELDDSPNKGPKKQLKVLADALDRTMSCETGARTANMGHAVKARYKGMFGGKPLEDLDMMEPAKKKKPLEDLDMMEPARDAVASAKKFQQKPTASRSLFGASEREEQQRFLRVRLRTLGGVDVPAPQFGNQYTWNKLTTRWQVPKKTRARANSDPQEGRKGG
jgi:hypothetical protein